MRVIKCLFIVNLLLLASMVSGQQPAGVIEVSGRVIQKGTVNSSEQPELELYVIDYGSVDIAGDGSFEFKAPKGLDLRIEIIPSEFKVVRPLDGYLDAETVNYQIDIFILHGTQDSLLKEQIATLDDQIKSLEEKNQLTENQIAQLDAMLLDTILHYERKQKALAKKIGQLQRDKSSLTQANKDLNDSLTVYKDLVSELQDSIKSLVVQLSVALEEKYLRQKAHYDEFSELLLTYQTKLKDLQDWLPQLEDCFNHQGALNSFNQICVQYGQARNALYEVHENHLEGINHYWEQPNVFENANELCELIFQSIHDEVVLKDINGAVMPGLKSFATKGIRKVKPVKKAGMVAHEKLASLIQDFDSRLQTLLSLLSEEI